VHQRQNLKTPQKTPPNIKDTKNKANTKIKDNPPHNNINKSCTKTLKYHHKLPQNPKLDYPRLPHPYQHAKTTPPTKPPTITQVAISITPRKHQ